MFLIIVNEKFPKLNCFACLQKIRSQFLKFFVPSEYNRIGELKLNPEFQGILEQAFVPFD